MRVPEEAAGGIAQITLSIPGWVEGNVTPGTIDGLVLGGRDDAPGIRAALEDASPTARAEILQGMGRFCGDTVGITELLIDLLDDPDERVRGGVVYALGSAPDAEGAVPALVRALDDVNSQIAVTAAAWLGQLKNRGEEVLPPLLDALRNGDDRVRWKCAQSLSGFDGQVDQVIPALIRALDDPAPDVRSQAAQTLRGWGEAAAPATERLLLALKDSDSKARYSAVEALQRISRQYSDEGVRLWVRRHHADASEDLARAVLHRRGAVFKELEGGGLAVRFGRHNTIDDGSVGLLADVRGVKEVSLAGTHVGDPGVANLRGAAIESLDLIDCDVTDAVFRYAAQLPSLKTLHVSESRNTAEGIARLRAELPECRVIVR